VELVIAVTLWLSFSAFLIFPTLNAPAVFSRTAIGLCASELVTVVLWSALPRCIAPGCDGAAEIAGSAAGVQIPALTGLLLLAALAYAVRTCRSSSPAPAARSARPPSTT